MKLHQRLNSILKNDRVRVPLTVFIGSRLVIYLLLTVFVGLLPNINAVTANFWRLMRRWDGDWYLRVAQEGYVWLGPTVQSTVAFFPLYPMLGRLVGWPFGDTRWGMFIVTNISFAIYLYFLYQWSKDEADDSTAERVIIYATAFPAAFVFASFYSEATLLAFVAGTFWYLQRGQFRTAMVMAALAGLTRLTGVALIFPVAYALGRQHQWRLLLLAFVMIPLGPILYGIYLWWLSGDPLVYVTIERMAWFRQFTLPWDTLRLALERATGAFTSYDTSLALLDVGSILLFMILVVGVWCYRSRGEFWYAFTIVLLTLVQTVDPTRAPLTQSAPRYLMAATPCFVVLALAGRNRYLDQIVRWTFIALQGIFAMYFFAGAWVV